jgi:hypothetical protein
MRISIRQFGDESGIIMPFVIGFLVILTTIGVTLAQTSTQTFNNSINFSYNQIAHIASKAAIDYAEEQYELNASYAGTPETDLHETDRYRSTIEIEVLYNQGSNAKRIRATGRVYVFTPNNGTADFVREIQASIIRNGAVAGNPADYEPIIWLDASAPDTLYQSSSASNSIVIDSLYGSSYDDVVEQKQSGSLTYNNDLEMTYDGSSNGYQQIGIRFRNVTVPKNTTVNSAYIQFTTDETKQSGPIELKVEGVATDNSSAWSGNNAVSSPTKTTAYVTWNPNDWNDVGQAGADERVEVTSIVQELVNRAGWNSGNNMSFTIQRVSGSGTRTAEAGSGSNQGPQLTINWGTASGGGPATSDGDPVGQWLDTSAALNDATLAYGVDGVLKKNQLNGYDAVRFTGNTILRADLNPSVSGNGITAFAVMLPRASSGSGTRFVSMMNSSQSNDTGTQNSAIPFQRYGTGSTMSQYYNNSYGETLSGAVDDNWSVYTSRLSSLYAERLLEDGVDNYSDPITSINYVLNQIYIGGARSGSSGAYETEFDLAELIIYDTDLVCSEIQQVENYLGLKYNITIATKGC